MHLLGVGIKNFTAYLEREGGGRQIETDKQTDRQRERETKKRGIRLRYQRERGIREVSRRKVSEKSIRERYKREEYHRERQAPMNERGITERFYQIYYVSQRERGGGERERAKNDNSPSRPCLRFALCSIIS